MRGESVCWGSQAWETQQTDYPRTRPDLPNHEPRGCPRGASYSWYLYSANRLKYPLVRRRLIEGPDVGGGNQLVQLFPVRADKPAFTACLSVALRFLRIVLNGIPGEYRVAVLRQRLAPEFNQPAAHQRIFEAVGAVEVPA